MRLRGVGRPFMARIPSSRMEVLRNSKEPSIRGMVEKAGIFCSCTVCDRFSLSGCDIDRLCRNGCSLSCSLFDLNSRLLATETRADRGAPPVRVRTSGNFHNAEAGPLHADSRSAEVCGCTSLSRL
eukprot:Gregarina_sp_Pseudo_9__2659@NODE_290_length_3272_cov_116_064027_g271_i0_p4_GENE_NODE_290_length_3272_cov_116_064027_g271_i0NODE_290_length_3272_cov_116_064027_g271_i0_p4_ORF_typecomplete_len126_score18_02Jas/PF16135_5/0_024Jas/PF16135_5/1_3e04Jas/PF16135_5/1_4e04NST1/PF13945_6/0_36_NODE_290_length_3272_cov_116_064027_g271_i024902867